MVANSASSDKVLYQQMTQFIKMAADVGELKGSVKSIENEIHVLHDLVRDVTNSVDSLKDEHFADVKDSMTTQKENEVSIKGLQVKAAFIGSAIPTVIGIIFYVIKEWAA